MGMHEIKIIIAHLNELISCASWYMCPGPKHRVSYTMIILKRVQEYLLHSNTNPKLLQPNYRI